MSEHTHEWEWDSFHSCFRCIVMDCYEAMSEWAAAVKLTEQAQALAACQQREKRLRVEPLEQWTYSDEEKPHGACYDCGLEYGSDAWADVILPDDKWEKINPSEHKGGGLLCFTCIVRRLNFIGNSSTFKITSGPLLEEQEA